MADPQSDRLKAIDTALGQIERQFGKGSIMRLGQQEAIGVPAIATGSLAVDAAIGVGGFPRGRVVEVYGPESSGKTTLALSVVAQAQKAGGVAAFIDAEHALDAEYAAKLGVDIENLLVSQPDSGEQALEIAEMLVRSNAVDIVAIDSVAALVPRAELEGEMGDSHVGLQARLMSQALRKLTAIVAKSRTSLVFINQIREKIGVMFGCLSYSSRVMLADGSQEKIGKIVNQKLPVEVLSYDRKLGRVVPKRVVNWFDNGRTEQFLQFTVARSGKNGRSQFACTDNHPIRTPDGWRRAHELTTGDLVMTAASTAQSNGHELVPMPITGIHVKPTTRSMQRFDIEIDGTHNFFADGVMVHNSPETTTGGRALKFYSSVRVDIRRIASIKDGDQVTGIRAKVKIVKNKVAPPFRAAEFDIDYGEGISRAGELLDLGVEHKVVGKSGAWYNYGDVRLGQGRENSKQFLRDNPDLADEIEGALREKLGLPGVTPKEAPPVSEVAETKAAAES